ncbi:MAG TPA: hypothetical protein VLC53_07470, partial [Myxococcota bacterium]|nr:hypothetical protein [Myxococcota bacterium]
RIFLRDGSMLVSYGEFARVADGIVVSIPLGGTESSPVLHLVTIAERDVDWDRTNAYVEAARARRYAETRGESDFAKLTREVADILNKAGTDADPARRLALAEAARRQLVEWPRQHHGYRAEEISQMTIWLDQVVSELRIAAGQSSFDLALVAAPPSGGVSVGMLPAPDFRERIELAMIAASRTPEPAERISLLRTVLDLLQPVLPEGSWMAALYGSASSELAAELRTDRAYAALTSRTLRRAAAYEGQADVRGLESLVRAVIEEDARLNRTRPAEVAALLATLDAKVDAARRLRLARDAWAERAVLVRQYWRDVRPGLDRLLGVREWLIDVRQLAGPASRSLRRLAAVAELAEKDLARVQPPAEVASAHATLAASSTLARRAATTRLEAIRSGNLATAWQASSAAAGSLMLLEQALEELRRITYAPAPAAR